MMQTANQLEPDVKAISRILNNLYIRHYDGARRSVLTEALSLLSENDRRILLYGLRRLLAVRVNVQNVG